jgi:hypothetical protein
MSVHCEINGVLSINVREARADPTHNQLNETDLHVCRESDRPYFFFFAK